MPALDFPTTPLYQQVYDKFTWDGEKWYLTVGGVPGPAPPFSPLTYLTGMLVWYDTSITASLTLSGTGVTSIADQSGAGLTATYANTRPEYSATAFNGAYPGMVFDTASPSNRALERASFPMGTGSTITVWWVGTLPHAASTVANNRVLSYIAAGVFDDATEVSSWVIHALSSKTTSTMQRNYTNVTTSAVAGSPSGHRFIYTIDSSGVITIYIDGAVMATGSLPGNWGTNGTLAIGRKATNNSDYGLNIISEVGIATGYHNAAMVALLDTYLRTKWGLIWQITGSHSLGTQSPGWAGYNLRQVFTAAEISLNGTQVRVTIRSGNAGLVIASAAIGHAAAAGDAYDFDGGQVAITFNGGSAGCTIGANTQIISDAKTFSLNETKGFVISLYVTSGDTLSGSGSGGWYKSGASEYLTTDVSGYTAGSSVNYAVSLVEVVP